MKYRIALAGNPNSGKTTLFNALTGSSQHVGNWPGVTVEKKEGKLKKRREVVVLDLPGIYSLSPYSLEEIISRDQLLDDRPDVILNIVDGSNLERNLYLSTQLLELSIPTVLAVNMMDVLEKSGDKIDLDILAQELGCRVVAISALKESGLDELIDACDEAAREKILKTKRPFSEKLEALLDHLQKHLPEEIPPEQRRYYALKIFERDEKILAKLKLDYQLMASLEERIRLFEIQEEDDTESIIASERYLWLGKIIQSCAEKKTSRRLSASGRIDRIVTNRLLALPIFALVMTLVYTLSVSTVGGWATDWVNDGVFGDGWRLFGIGTAQYEEAAEAFAPSAAIREAFLREAESRALDAESEEAKEIRTTAYLYDENGEITEALNVDYERFLLAKAEEEPEPAAYGTFIPSLPSLIHGGLEKMKCADWLHDLILDGIVAGVGAVLGFVPQMLVLFLFLAFLEGCGYMARVAFIMDRIFRRFGLSGKSFIPMLIGTGCSVPGIMATRTIENDRDRKMTAITTPFIPCSAKLPIIALMAGAIYGRAAWVSPSAYFLGFSAVVLSGVMLKKTRFFAGDPAPFVMELPNYHWPSLSYLTRSAWERSFAFIKKAGSIILLASIFIWFSANYGFVDGDFGRCAMPSSILAAIGNALAFLFRPLGWGFWQAAVATITGLIAKENIIGAFGILFGGFDEVAENGWQIWQNMRDAFTPLSAYSFLTFNLLCAPCFAAIGAIRREMNHAGWTAFAIGWQCSFAYLIAFMIYQFGLMLNREGQPLGFGLALFFLAAMLYLLFRPEKKYE